jgi:hypothetical protein
MALMSQSTQPPWKFERLRLHGLAAHELASTLGLPSRSGARRTPWRRPARSTSWSWSAGGAAPTRRS